jgi:hypothetical protein
MFKKYLVAAVIALGIASSPHAQHATILQPKVKVVGDWAYGCQGGKKEKYYCEAVSLTPENVSEREVISIKIGRLYPYGGYVNFPSSMRSEPSQYKIFIDGRLIKKDLLFYDKHTKEMGYDGHRLMDSIRLFALKGRELSVQDKKGKNIGTVSLNGFSDTLSALDKLQKLSATKHALVSRGGKNVKLPSPSMYRPPAAPLVESDLIDRETIARFVATIDCGGEKKLGDEHRLIAFKFDKDEALLLVDCGKNGINTVFKPYNAMLNQKTGVWSFKPGFYYDDKEQTNVTMSLLYNVELKYSSLSSTRYLKNEFCGDRYDFTYAGGRQDTFGSLLRLSSTYEMPVCRGVKEWIAVD